SAWREMGFASPDVFKSIAYYAPARPDQGSHTVPVSTPRPGYVRAFSWSLKDVIDFGLFELLFSDETRANENMVALIDYLRRRLSTTRARVLALPDRLRPPPAAAPEQVDARR